jgi:hypothetical protein
MENRFFEKPIINSPYKYPQRHWELDEEGQPTHGKNGLSSFIQINGSWLIENTQDLPGFQDQLEQGKPS